MINININAVVDMEVDGIDIKDYPDFVDAYVSYAYSTELKRELTDEELDYLNEQYPEIAQELAYNKVF